MTKLMRMHKNLIKNNNHDDWSEVAKMAENNRLKVLNILVVLVTVELKNFKENFFSICKGPKYKFGDNIEKIQKI